MVGDFPLLNVLQVGVAFRLQHALDRIDRGGVLLCREILSAVHDAVCAAPYSFEELQAETCGDDEVAFKVRQDSAERHHF